jgi:hypothetical protein
LIERGGNRINNSFDINLKYFVMQDPVWCFDMLVVSSDHAQVIYRNHCNSYVEIKNNSIRTRTLDRLKVLHKINEYFGKTDREQMIWNFARMFFWCCCSRPSSKCTQILNSPMMLKNPFDDVAIYLKGSKNQIDYNNLREWK